MTVADDDQPVHLIQDVTAPQCAEVRQRVFAAALQAGLSDDDATRFMLGVNEIVINGVTHGGGAVAVAIRINTRSITVEVSDQGTGIPDTAGSLPPTDAPGGRGIWLARHFSDEFTIRNGAEGTVVRLTALRSSDPSAA